MDAISSTRIGPFCLICPFHGDSESFDGDTALVANTVKCLKLGYLNFTVMVLKLDGTVMRLKASNGMTYS